MIYGIIGPNGSGKTTLLGAFTRLVKLTQGELLFDGKDYKRLRPHKLASLGVARTFQMVRLLPELDVRKNVLLGLDAHATEDAGPGGGRWDVRARRAAKSAAVDAALRQVGLDGLGSYFPSEFSYGTQRRVEIARAIAMQPRLLLLDEPMAGMNQKERGEISQLLRSMRSPRLAQLLVEHDVQVIIDTCDYVYAMSSGTLIAEGPPEQVVRDPRVQEAYLGRKWRHHA
jgi:branched-chain amino acid transport system ATP-binding protein